MEGTRAHQPMAQGAFILEALAGAAALVFGGSNPRAVIVRLPHADHFVWESNPNEARER